MEKERSRIGQRLLSDSDVNLTKSLPTQQGALKQWLKGFHMGWKWVGPVPPSCSVIGWGQSKKNVISFKN